MNEMCGDNRFEIIARAKKHLLDATNIDTSADEMKVLDDFLYRCWQMGWLDRYDRKTENSSEKPNNCEHITEDGVTCAKYPACDDCLDNPLNKVKGSKRLIKGSEQTDLVEDSPSLVKDLVNAFCEDGTWLERQGVYTLTLAEAKQRAVDIIEAVSRKDTADTPQTDVYDYKGNGKWERSK